MAQPDAAELKQIRATKFPDSFKTKIDIRKVNTDVLKAWMATRITSLLGGLEDDVTVDFAYELLTDKSSVYPNIRLLQIKMAGFLGEKEAAVFCEELWGLMRSAQESALGVPAQLLEAKKAELLMEREAAEKRALDDRARKERDSARDRDTDDRRRRDRRDRTERRRPRSRSPPRRRDTYESRRYRSRTPPPPRQRRREDSSLPPRRRRSGTPPPPAHRRRSSTPPPPRRRRGSSVSVSSRSPPSKKRSSSRRRRNTSSDGD